MIDRHKWIGTISGIIGILTFITGISSIPQVRVKLKSYWGEKERKERPAAVIPATRVQALEPSSLETPSPEQTKDIDLRREIERRKQTNGLESPGHSMDAPSPPISKDISDTFKAFESPTVHNVNFGAQYDFPVINSLALKISGTFSTTNVNGLVTINAIFSTASGTPLRNPQGGVLVTSTGTTVKGDDPTYFILVMPYYNLPPGNLSYNLVIDYADQRLFISEPQLFSMRANP
ncbi:MAG TPA: hypothetical protein VGG20_00565 [Thermoanaerobaculia bacterium]|jgi:hypothetical protein